jgi:hypothetical protein
MTSTTLVSLVLSLFSTFVSTPTLNTCHKPQHAGDATTQDLNSSTAPLDLDVSSPGSSTRKHPMGRDAAKAERKKAASILHEYAAKMHELSIEKISLFKESEAEQKVRLDKD